MYDWRRFNCCDPNPYESSMLLFVGIRTMKKGWRKLDSWPLLWGSLHYSLRELQIQSSFTQILKAQSHEVTFIGAEWS